MKNVGIDSCNLDEFKNSIVFNLVINLFGVGLILLSVIRNYVSIKNTILLYTPYVKVWLVTLLKVLILLLLFSIAVYVLLLSYLELATPLYCCTGEGEIKATIEQYQAGVEMYKWDLHCWENKLKGVTDPNQRSIILNAIEENKIMIQESEEARREFMRKLSDLQRLQEASSNHNISIGDRPKRSITEAGSGFENTDSKRRG